MSEDSLSDRVTRLEVQTARNTEDIKSGFRVLYGVAAAIGGAVLYIVTDWIKNGGVPGGS